jgi:uncharacterized protein
MAAKRQLYDLQTVDLELDWRHARLAEITAALGDDSALKPVRAEVARRKTVAQKSTGDQTNLDTIIGGFEEKIAAAETKLYGGTVTLARELQDLQADIDMIKRQRGEQEDLLLEVLDKVDEAQKSYDSGAKTLAKREAAWLTNQESMIEEHSVIEGELGGLQADRDARAAGVAAPELALYDSVRKAHQGKAVALMHGSMCDACRVGIPSRQAQDARNSDKPVRCPSCGLILLPE